MESTVLCLVGAGRSGSTLLELLLENADPRVASVGELHQIWGRGVTANEACGCGEAFLSCWFWRSVGEKAFGGWHSRTAREAADLRAHLERHRRFFQLRRLHRRPYARDPLQRYQEVLKRLYSAIAEVSGAELIVDASKWPPHADVLIGSGIDVRLVQVVRHPGGFVAAKQKAVPRLIDPASGNVTMMQQRPPMVAAWEWIAFNLYGWFLGRSGTPYLRVAYERLAEDPERTVDLILEHALPQERSTSNKALQGHGISGNPLRQKGLPPVIAPDTAWREARRLREAVAMAPALPFWWALRRTVAPTTHRS